MKNYLLYYLLITLSIIVNSCSEGFKDEPIKYATTGWQLIARQVDGDDNGSFSDDELFNTNAYNKIISGVDNLVKNHQELEKKRHNLGLFSILVLIVYIVSPIKVGLMNLNLSYP